VLFFQICLRIWNFAFQVWEASFGVNIVDAASQQIYDASKLADQLVMESKAAKQIGFIGLGAMGFGMASHLLKSGFCVVAYDVRTLLTFLSFPTP
jgi:phosphoglycerate dehydrogenase-like enzyme